jgi:hypothetical protein
MPGVIKQNVLIRFDDPDPIILKMFFEPIRFDERFGMRVFSWMRSHSEISAGALNEQGISLR